MKGGLNTQRQLDLVRDLIDQVLNLVNDYSTTIKDFSIKDIFF